jgi:hypothetical protein
MGDEPFVLLCECRNVGELQLVRSALEANSVPMRIEGEATHGVLGAIHGAAQMPRVLVPPKWLEAARAIATDIVGPFDDAPLEDDDDEKGSPFREDAGLDDAARDDAELDDPDDAGPLVRRKMLGVPFLLVMLGLAVGFGHIYAGRMRTGIALLALAIIGVIDAVFGAGWGVFLLIAVELFDLVGGLVGVAQYNRKLRSATPP